MDTVKVTHITSAGLEKDVIEIDRKLWLNISVMPDCKFRLYGQLPPHEVIEFQKNTEIDNFIKEKQCCKNDIACGTTCKPAEPEVVSDEKADTNFETIEDVEPVNEQAATKPESTTKTESKKTTIKRKARKHGK